MKEITAYEAKDGTVFNTKKEAENYETMLSFRDWYENNELYGNYEGSRVYFADLVKWLKENRTVVKAFVNTL